MLRWVRMSAFGGKADITRKCPDVCFSNRPVGVKRFQAIRHCGVDVARGLVLAAAASLVHLNSVPSIQMRCIITANRRASATIAFFIPRCLAIFIAQALSHDHFAERSSMTWAAS